MGADAKLKMSLFKLYPLVYNCASFAIKNKV